MTAVQRSIEEAERQQRVVSRLSLIRYAFREAVGRRGCVIRVYCLAILEGSLRHQKYRLRATPRRPHTPLAGTKNVDPGQRMLPLTHEGRVRWPSRGPAVVPVVTANGPVVSRPAGHALLKRPQRFVASVRFSPCLI